MNAGDQGPRRLVGEGDQERRLAPRSRSSAPAALIRRPRRPRRPRPARPAAFQLPHAASRSSARSAPTARRPAGPPELLDRQRRQQVLDPRHRLQEGAGGLRRQPAGHERRLRLDAAPLDRGQRRLLEGGDAGPGQGPQLDAAGRPGVDPTAVPAQLQGRPELLGHADLAAAARRSRRRPGNRRLGGPGGPSPQRRSSASNSSENPSRPRPR